MTKTALVTGGSGFIGSEVIRQLIAKGIRVKALLRKTSSTENLKGMTYETALGDLSDYEALLKAVEGVDYVFHLAGALNAKNQEEYNRHNGIGTQNLARACAEKNPSLKRFLYVSSLAASGPSTSTTPKTEKDTDQAISQYGKSKYQGEVELRNISQDGSRFPMTIIRPPSVYGPRDKAVLEFIKIVNKGIIPLFPKKEVPSLLKRYSLIHVDDLVRGIVLSGLSENQSPMEIFYLCEDNNYTWADIMTTMAGVLNKKPIQVRLPESVLKSAALILKGVGRITKKPHPMTCDKIDELKQDYWICSNQSAKEKLGFKPQWSLKEGMSDTIGWYKQNGWL